MRMTTSTGIRSMDLTLVEHAVCGILSNRVREPQGWYEHLQRRGRHTCRALGGHFSGPELCCSSSLWSLRGNGWRRMRCWVGARMGFDSATVATVHAVDICASEVDRACSLAVGDAVVAVLGAAVPTRFANRTNPYVFSKSLRRSYVARTNLRFAFGFAASAAELRRLFSALDEMVADGRNPLHSDGLTRGDGGGRMERHPPPAQSGRGTEEL